VRTLNWGEEKKQEKQGGFFKNLLKNKDEKEEYL
jgi:hypothetical protein